jgi:hypothetical protein
MSLALKSLGAGCQSDLAVGEAPTEIMTDNVRFLTVLGDKDTLHGQSLLIPQSSFQAFNHIPTPSVVAYLNFSSSEGITTYLLANNPTSYATNSSKVIISHHSVSDASDFGLDFVVTLRNVRPINYWTINATTFHVRCFDYHNKPYHQSVTCSNGQTYHVSCPPNAKGMYSVHCPTYRTAPVCTVRPSGSDVDFIESRHCHVVEYDSYSTSCKCSFSGSGSVPYRLLSDSTTLEYSSNMIVTETLFSSTLTKVEYSNFLISTLFFTFGVMVIGFIWMLYKDVHDVQSFSPKKNSSTRTTISYFESFFPIDLRYGPWNEVWREFMLCDHPWLKSVSSCSLFREVPEDNRSKVTPWVIAMGELLTFVFISSLIAVIFYPDDGSCEALITKNDCISAKVIGLTAQACSWRSDNEFCEFREPPIRIDVLLALIFLISLVFIPLKELLMFLVVGSGPSFHKFIMQGRTALAKSDEKLDNITTNELIRDEFRMPRNSKATMLRAAKLEKMQQTMDYVPSMDVARWIQSISIKSEFNRKNNQISAGEYVSLLHDSRYVVMSRDASIESLCREIDYARHRAIILSNELDLLGSDEAKELKLMRYFLADLFWSPHRHVAYKQFLQPNSVPFSEMISSFLLVVISSYFGIMIFFLVKFNSTLGSRSMQLWLLSTFLAVIQDVLFVKPLTIWLNSVVINGTVSVYIRDVVENLSFRSRLIVMRTFGVMRDADALVQHFNPACRVARMYPQLPISRLLMSINDFDLSIPEPRGISFFLAFSSISILPKYIFTAALDLICLSSMDIACFLTYLLGNLILSVFPAVLILPFIALLLFIILRVLIVVPDAKFPRSDAHKVHASNPSTSNSVKIGGKRCSHQLKDLNNVLGKFVSGENEWLLSPAIESDQLSLKLEQCEVPQLIEPSAEEYDDFTQIDSVPTLHSIRTKPSTSSLAIFHQDVSREDVYRRESDSKSLEIETSNDVEVMESNKDTMPDATILHTMLSTKKLASKGKVTDRERKGLQQSYDGRVRRYSQSNHRGNDRKVTTYEHHIANHFVSTFITDDALENNVDKVLSIDRVSVDSPLGSIHLMDDSSTHSLWRERSNLSPDPGSLRYSTAVMESSSVVRVKMESNHFIVAGVMPSGVESSPAALEIQSLPVGVDESPEELIESTPAVGLMMIHPKPAVVESIFPLNFIEERVGSITDAEFDDNLMALMNQFNIDDSVRTTNHVGRSNKTSIQLWDAHSYPSLQMELTMGDSTAADIEFENSLKELMTQFQYDEDVDSSGNPIKTDNGHHRRSQHNAKYTACSNNQMEDCSDPPNGFTDTPIVDRTWSSRPMHYCSRHRRRNKDNGLTGPGVHSSILHKQTGENLSFQCQWNPQLEEHVIAADSIHCGTGPGRSLDTSSRHLEQDIDTNLHKSRFPMFI